MVSLLLTFCSPEQRTNDSFNQVKKGAIALHANRFSPSQPLRWPDASAWPDSSHRVGNNVNQHGGRADDLAIGLDRQRAVGVDYDTARGAQVANVWVAFVLPAQHVPANLQVVEQSKGADEAA